MKRCTASFAQLAFMRYTEILRFKETLSENKTDESQLGPRTTTARQKIVTSIPMKKTQHKSAF